MKQTITLKEYLKGTIDQECFLLSGATELKQVLKVKGQFPKKPLLSITKAKAMVERGKWSIACNRDRWNLKPVIEKNMFPEPHLIRWVDRIMSHSLFIASIMGIIVAYVIFSGWIKPYIQNVKGW